MLRQLNNQNKGGEKASRKYPKCHSKKIQKNGIIEKSQLDRKPLSWRKHLSLGSVFILQGISEILKNRLKIGTMGDISNGHVNKHSKNQLNACRELTKVLTTPAFFALKNNYARVGSVRRLKA